VAKSALGGEADGMDVGLEMLDAVETAGDGKRKKALVDGNVVCACIQSGWEGVDAGFFKQSV
jgi:hypothetical protein